MASTSTKRPLPTTTTTVDSSSSTSEELKDFRLFISGLNPLIKLKDLTERFQTFGEIKLESNSNSNSEHHELKSLDANGNPRTFAFLTLNTTEKQIKKCTSMLSGSMWKGHKLKIQLAKQDYYSKIAAERAEIVSGLNNNSTFVPKKKRKMNLKPNSNNSIGTQSKHFELINLSNLHLHPGWILDTSTTPSTPLYPLLTRPSHSIPLPPSIKSQTIITSWTRGETPKAKAAKELKKLKKLRQGIVPNILIKAFRLKIDVRRWGRKKILFSREEEGGVGRGWNSSSSSGIKGSWECLEPNEEDEEGGGGGINASGDIEWVFRTKDGIIRRKEIVRMAKRIKPHTDSFKALLDAMDVTIPTPSTATTTTTTTTTASAIIIPSIDNQIEKVSELVELDVKEEPFISAFSPEPSPSLSTSSKSSTTNDPFATTSTLQLPSSSSSSSSPLFPSAHQTRPRSISPPSYISLPPRSLIYNEEDSFALLTSIEDTKEAFETRRLERLGQLDLLEGLLSRGGNAEEMVVVGGEGGEKEERVGKPEVEGYGEEDDDFFDGHVKARGENVNTEGKRLVVLRLRGGGPVGSKDEVDDDEKMVVEGEEVKKVVKKEKTSLQMNSLKAMFKPQEEDSTSFSIFSSLDLEMDDDSTLRSPSPEPISYPSNTALYSTSSSLPTILDKSTMTPFQIAQQAHSDRHGFVPPTALGGGGGRNRNWIGTGPSSNFFPFCEERLSKEVLRGVGMELSEEKVEELKRSSEEVMRVSTASFWRSESLEEITAKHAALQESLRGMARKRHREASKRVRKKGQGKIRIAGGERGIAIEELVAE